jgi:hypothetical protein
VSESRGTMARMRWTVLSGERRVWLRRGRGGSWTTHVWERGSVWCSWTWYLRILGQVV